MDECGEKNAISLSWGRREIRISGERGHPVCERCPHDMTMMLETIRGAGARPEKDIPRPDGSPLLRDGLPCCRDVKAPGHGTGPFRIYGQVSVSDRGKGHSFQAEMQ